MNIPSPERWRELSPLLDELLDLDAPARQARLDALRADSAESADLVEQLRALLAHDDEARSGGFMAGAAVDPGGEPEAQASLAGQRLGAYVLQAPLGQGGGGSVWRALREDGRYDGAVAIKLLHLSLIGHAGAERFRREGQILARLMHAHIARLLDAGVTPGGQPYLVIELVEGQRIDQHCDAHRLSVEARLALFDDVLSAVAHAHTHGVIHRDLKPGNILVTADGAVKLLDFGIAKLLADEAGSAESTELTREGGRALTPDYAAPEQLRGEGVTTATDVYALGVLLYQLLCGSHPTAPLGGNASQALRATLETEPLAPSRRVSGTDSSTAGCRASHPQRLQHLLAGDLDTIVSHALRKRPAERYATVAAFAEDLRRYRAHEPVVARPDSLAYRTRKFVRRHRGAVAASLLTTLAISAGLVGTVWQAQRAQTEALRAQEQRDLALEKMAESQDIAKLLSLITTAMPDKGQFTRESLMAAAVRAVQARPDLEARRKANMLLALSESTWYAGRDLDLAVRLATQAHELVKDHGDPSVRAGAACPLAAQLSQKGQLAQAQALLASSLAALGDAPRQRSARINCLVYASDLAIDQNLGAEALQQIEAARALLPRLELPDLGLERSVWSRVAQARRVAGHYPAALAAYEQLARVDQQIGADASMLEGTRLINWAVTLKTAGRPRDALEKLQRALALQGGDAASPPPALLSALADSYLKLDQASTALTLAQRAEQASRASGNLQQADVATWGQVGALQQLGRPAEALALLDGLETRNRANYPPTFFWFSLALGMRGLLSTDPAQAAAFFDRSVQHQQGNGCLHLARALLLRGMFALSQGRRLAARADAEQAAALLKSLLGDGLDSQHLGESENLLAQIDEADGRAQAARLHYALAARHFASALGTTHAKAVAARLASAQP